MMKTSQLMLYREIMAVFSEIHKKHINTVCGQNVELLNVKLAVHTYIHTYNDHWALEGSISVIKTIQLMLYREIMAVSSEIHTTHINTSHGQNVESLNVKLAVHIETTGL